MSFADGTDFSDDEIGECVEVCDNHGLKVNWEPGDAVLVRITCSIKKKSNLLPVQRVSEGAQKKWTIAGFLLFCKPSVLLILLSGLKFEKFEKPVLSFILDTQSFIAKYRSNK